LAQLEQQSRYDSWNANISNREIKLSKVKTLRATITEKLINECKEEILDKDSDVTRIKIVDEYHSGLYIMIGSKSATFHAVPRRGKTVKIHNLSPGDKVRSLVPELRERSISMKTEVQKEEQKIRDMSMTKDGTFTLQDFLHYHYIIETALPGSGYKSKDDPEVKRLNLDFAMLMDKRLCDITKGDIESWKQTYKPHLMEASKKRSYTTLRSVFSFAVDKGYLSENPIAGVKFREERRQKFQALPDHKIKKLIDHFNTDTPRNNLIFRLILLTGARPSEIFTLKVSDVNLDNNTISIFNTDIDDKTKKMRVNKAGVYRSIHVPDSAMDLLTKYLEDIDPSQEYLFMGKRGVPLESFRKPVENARRAVGFDFKLYDLRRTYATTMARMKVHITEIQYRMGHSTIDQTREYIQIEEVIDKDTPNLVAEYYGAD
jgi:integrase/recombinase XerD